MPVTVIANRNLYDPDKQNHLEQFYEVVAALTAKHGLKFDDYYILIRTAVGDCCLVDFNPDERTAEFVFAQHAVFEGKPRAEIETELNKFVRFAEELSQITLYDIIIQKPLNY